MTYLRKLTWAPDYLPLSVALVFLAITLARLGLLLGLFPLRVRGIVKRRT